MMNNSKINEVINMVVAVVKKDVQKVIREEDNAYIIFKNGYVDDNMVRIEENGRAVFCHPFSDQPEEVIFE